jgi:drug/metabolite transporter (DMT)-like permease
MDSYTFSILAAVCASFLFGLLVHIQRRGLQSVDPVAGALISVASMAAGLWACAPVFGGLEQLRHPAVIYFAIAGLGFPALGQFFQIRSVSLMGPSMTAALGAAMPFFAALPAVMFLDEVLTGRMMSGFALMAAGLAAVALSGRKRGRVWPVWAPAVALLAPLARGVMQPVSKAGLQQLPDPYIASLVMGTVSTVVLSVIVAASGKTRELRRAGRGGGWFALNGLVNASGFIALNAALSSGDVTVVAPLAAASPLWALLMGWLVFRSERLTWHHLAVAVLVVAGGMLVIAR